MGVGHDHGSYQVNRVGVDGHRVVLLQSCFRRSSEGSRGGRRYVRTPRSQRARRTPRPWTQLLSIPASAATCVPVGGTHTWISGPVAARMCDGQRTENRLTETFQELNITDRKRGGNHVRQVERLDIRGQRPPTSAVAEIER